MSEVHNKAKERERMNEFIAKYGSQMQGKLSGFDRLVFRGTLRRIAYPFGMNGYLWANQVLLKDFGAHANRISEQVKEAALRCVLEAGRPVQYLQSSKSDKEKMARSMAEEQGIRQGAVCALTCVEPCWGFDVHRNRETKQLDLVQRSRKCLYVYQYWQHPVLGWLNARIQTWFPFSIQICMNGREWLARQMDRAGMAYRQQDNCFPWVADWEQAQRLMNTQLQADWPELLSAIACRLNPIHNEIFQRFPLQYYWSTYQSELATDIVFGKAEDLRRLYPLFVHHAMTTFRSPDVLRFLGKNVTAGGHISGKVQAEVTSDLKRRQEGVRIKHRYNDNSVKLYDKAYTPAGSVLRAEMTMQNPEDFKVYRPTEGDPDGARTWQRMRKGIADLHRRAEVSQKANERYLNALAATDDSTSLQELLNPIEKPVTWKGKRVRALHPFDEQDKLLLESISRGEFVINGLRNRDLQPLIYASKAKSVLEFRRRSAALSRKLRMLRAHHILRKIPGTHRYQVTSTGRQLLMAIIAASHATVNMLIPKAA
jgi:hypothetical protein